MTAPAAIVPELETKRLRLRNWRDDDVDRLAAIVADPEVMRYVRKPLSRAQAESEIDRFRAHWSRWAFGHWAVEERATGSLLGRLGLLHHPDWLLDRSNVEVGWILARCAWGRGLAPEGGREALRFAFGTRGIERIISITRPDNHRSVRVMEKLRLVRSGETNWRGHHVVWYSARRDEWLSGETEPPA
jgi:RimJ/RimL family protein N-acetyltransferase